MEPIDNAYGLLPDEAAAQAHATVSEAVGRLERVLMSRFGVSAQHAEALIEQWWTTPSPPLRADLWTPLDT